MENKVWTEAQMIDAIRMSKALAPEALGLFDDCAVILKDNEHSFLISQDSSVEGVHFLEQFFSPQEIAHKVFHTTISDIAAMGGIPLYILLALSLPQGRKESWIKAFAHSFSECARKAGVKILGGDTTRSPGGLFISATVIGSVANKFIKKRSTAQPGNLIAITGQFGYAALGLALLDKPELCQKFPTLVAAQKTPCALIERGIMLGQSSAVTAMLDVSDGILRDTENLCKASKLGARLDCEKIPLPAELVDAAKALEVSALKTVLEGGEDYGLMVALDHQADPELLERTVVKAELRIIGYLSSGALAVTLDNAPQSFLENPPVIFEHGGKL